MKKYFVIISILIVIFVSACETQEEMKGGSANLLSYENKDLGISFNYPSNFKVYQQSDDRLSIDSGYKDPQHAAVEIVMGIRRINANRENLEKIEARINPDVSDLIKYAESLTTKEAYDILLKQLESSKKSNPEMYKAIHGDKTPEEAAREAFELNKKQIEELKRRKTYNTQNKGNYDIINVENGKFYYILSDKGTFYISDTLEIDAWKPLFEQDGVYQEYKNQFDKIKDSLKII